MAELAIPLAVLGGLYIISNQNKEKEKEGFEANRRYLTNTNNEIRNYPVLDVANARGSVNEFSGAKHTEVEKYNPTKKLASVNNNKAPGTNKFRSLTGEVMHKGEITHNNMQPFFGSTVTQSTSGGGYEGLLDVYTGSGSQNIEKRAQAPMFKPQANMDHPYGAPNQSDFMQDRMRGNIGSKLNNSKPWNEIRVAPGLAKGYGTQGSGGFNSGMEARDLWQPKTVDELRVQTNPKNTYRGQVLGAHVGRRGPRGEHGKVEKNRPDTYFIQQPDRWLTTTGAGGEAPRQRAKNILKETNYDTTSEYYGTGGETQAAGGIYQKGVYQDPTKQQLKGYDLGGAHAPDKTGITDKDYGKDGYKPLPNNRVFTGENQTMGNAFNSALTALTTPVLDMLRPTRKQNVIGNMRPVGNARGRAGVDNPSVWNPADKLKTTIKEQTIDNKYIGMRNRNHGGSASGYTTSEHQPVSQHRDTTNCHFTPNAGATPGTTKSQIYNNYRNATLNPNKQVVSKVDRYHIGNGKLHNSNINVTNLRNRAVNQAPVHRQGPTYGSSAAMIGTDSSRHLRETALQCGRNDGANLTPFHQNPYTHSLSSAV